jgi:hypothetical protein
VKKTDENKLRFLAAKECKKALATAIEWMDKKEFSWATVQAKRALQLLDILR